MPDPKRFPLAHALLDLWRRDDSGRYLRFVAHLEAVRVNHRIPSILG